MLTEQQLKLLKNELRTKALTSTSPREVTLEKLEAYSSGDFWGENGKFWRGRKPVTGTLDEVSKLFIADDRINTAVRRFVSATIGRDFEWDAMDVTQKLDSEPNAFIDELEKALTDWHVDADFFAQIKLAVKTRFSFGSTSLKVYIPNAYVEQARKGVAKTLAEALEFIHILALTPVHAGVLRDPHGRTLAHYHEYTLSDENEKISQKLEIHTPEDVSIYTIDGGEIVLDTNSTVPNPLFDSQKLRKPNFLMREIAREDGSLFTQSIFDKQDALNESWTNLKRNDQLAGFRSIITTNAEDPQDDKGNPIAWTFGPARVINLNGIVTSGDDAQPEGIASPTVIVVDPVNPLTSSIPTIEKLIDAILDAFDQTWTLKASANNVSGESKKESRRAFDKRVIEEAGDVIETIKWVLETVLALAAWLEGNEFKYANVRINPKLFLDVERGNLELFNALIPAFEKNLVSLETLVLANPAAEDQTAELQRLQRPPKLTPERADAAVSANRLSRLASLENQGYTSEEATAIVTASLEEAQMLAAGIAPTGGG